MKRLLVVANETVGGTPLIDAVKRHAEAGEVKVTVVCPQNQPKGGWVIYEESARSAAANRLETTLASLREIGVQAEGEVMDPDPFTATTDAVNAFGADAIIISTYPDTRSGWMRQDLIERVERDTGLPVEHVVVDLDAEREDVTRTLVVANQTVDSEPLFQRIAEKHAEGARLFTVVVPAAGGAGDPNERLGSLLKRLADQNIQGVGQVGHPDAFTAIQNALQFYKVDEILIATFEGERSGWLRANLIERVQGSTSCPVEHVVATREEVAS
ncbi:MAG TPA: universal stress protein [Thermoleophilaceae bacterium]|nr:universal stress protein [Thermoleophilaceae bacterium]